ncbi:S35F6 protein, partial [Caloenas nicobarica]|nr:S35F6 protein [Caloenas nicobarica]
SLSHRWADNFSAPGCGGTEEHGFQHPFLQAVGMFLGEFSCLGVFYLLVWRDRRRPEPSTALAQPFNPLLFLPPALCDMTGTSIMYVGKCWGRGDVTSVPSRLSLRLSGCGTQWYVKFWGRTLKGSEQTLLTCVMSCGRTQHEEEIVCVEGGESLAQAGQRGFFGFLILALLLVPMYYIPAGSFSGNPRRTLEDALDAFCQIGQQPLIALALLGNISSIAFFNFAGISVTKEISATTRMVLDSLRTLVIWAVSLAVGWETFHGLEILGFGVLLTGAALYNGLHRPLLARLPRHGEESGEAAEREGLLHGDSTAINSD